MKKLLLFAIISLFVTSEASAIFLSGNNKRNPVGGENCSKENRALGGRRCK